VTAQVTGRLDMEGDAPTRPEALGERSIDHRSGLQPPLDHDREAVTELATPSVAHPPGVSRSPSLMAASVQIHNHYKAAHGSSFKKGRSRNS
jgi:hypothetical protein